MASLTSLPTELLHKIVLCMPRSRQQRLLYVCRHFYHIIQQILYRTIQIDLKPEDRNPNSVIAQLFRTLRTNPVLASYVQQLVIFGSKPLTLATDISDTLAQECGGPECPFEDCIIHQCLGTRRPRVGEYDHYMCRFMKGDSDVIIASLISFLVNLRVLRLGFVVWSESRYLPAIFPLLERLEEIDLSNSDTEPAPSVFDFDYEITHDDYAVIFKTMNGPIYYDPKQLEALFFAPEVKTITAMITEPNNSWFTAPYNKPTEASPMLTCLRLRQSEITPSSLKSLLRMTPYLQQFEYHHCINTDSGPENMRYFQSAEMDSALQPVRSTLKCLRIHVEFFSHGDSGIWPGTSWGLQGTMKSLTEFPCLTDLEIPLELLVGWSPVNDDDIGRIAKLETVLPPSLEELTFVNRLHCFLGNQWQRWNTYSLVSDYVESLAATRMHVQNSLQWTSLYFYFSTKDNPADEPELTRLNDVCDKAGIFVEIGDRFE